MKGERGNKTREILLKLKEKQNLLGDYIHITKSTVFNREKTIHPKSKPSLQPADQSNRKSASPPPRKTRPTRTFLVPMANKSQSKGFMPKQPSKGELTRSNINTKTEKDKPIQASYIIRKQASRVSLERTSTQHTPFKSIVPVKPSKPIYSFWVGPKNNPAICNAAMNTRSWWSPAASKETAQFVWLARFNMSYDFFQKGRQTKLINRFERYFEIHDKDNLFRNLWFHCQKTEKDVFQYMPLSFSFRLKQENFYEDLQKFARIFLSIKEGKPPKEIMPLASENNKKLANNSIFYEYKGVPNSKKKSNQGFKSKFSNLSGECECLPMPDSLYAGKNLWVLKPSFMSRGRGIEIFSSLEELDKLLATYLEGYEAKDYAVLNYSDTTEKSPIVNMTDDTPPPQESNTKVVKKDHAYFMKKFVPESVPTFPVFVIQKYIEKPLLYKGFKFDIRMYGCLTHEKEVYTMK